MAVHSYLRISHSNNGKTCMLIASTQKTNKNGIVKQALKSNASLTRARTSKNHSKGAFSDSHESFLRLKSSNYNFNNNLLLHNSNTQSFLLINRSFKEIYMPNQMLKHLLCFHAQCVFEYHLFSPKGSKTSNADKINFSEPVLLRAI